MSKEADKKAIADAIGSLRQIVDKAPANFGAWSYGKTLDFKESHAKAKRAMNRERPSLESLRGALSALRGFYD